MDEGLNTFVEYLTEELWDNKFPSRRGPAHTIVDYMKLPKDQLEPIMTNSENINHFGPNAYAKPATGLNILRETVMGRALFDKAFKTYAKRWAFRHPEPADFFRTMNDASAENLDWFWRGWFYGIDPVDISIDQVTVAEPNLESVSYTHLDVYKRQLLMFTAPLPERQDKDTGKTAPIMKLRHFWMKTNETLKDPRLLPTTIIRPMRWSTCGYNSMRMSSRP